MTLIRWVVAATRQTYTLLFNTHHPPIVCAAVAGTCRITPLRELKFFKSTNLRGGRLSARHRKLAPNTNICTHRAGEIGLLSECVGSGLSSLFGAPDVSNRVAHSSSGRESQLLQTFLTGNSWFGLTSLSCSLLWGCRLFLIPSGIGDKGLWSKEGCGAGPNVHRTPTGIRESATAGILDSRALCLADRLYPGLQIEFFPMTYMQAPLLPRQVLHDWAIPSHTWS